PVPGWLMLRFGKVATPLTAVTVAVPDRVPRAGLVSIATVMLVLALVTVFPSASCTVTATVGLIAASAAAPVGCTVKASLVAARSRCGSKPPEAQAKTSQRSWITALVSFLDMGSPPLFQHHGRRCRMVPPEPTAQTSLAPLPQALEREFVVPIETHDQTLPF